MFNRFMSVMLFAAIFTIGCSKSDPVPVATEDAAVTDSLTDAPLLTEDVVAPTEDVTSVDATNALPTDATQTKAP